MIWLCGKSSELNAMLFLTFTPFYQKMTMFEQLENQVLLDSKFFFDPSLERSWCGLFKLCYGWTSPLIQPNGVIEAPPPTPPTHFIISKIKFRGYSVHLFRGPWFRSHWTILNQNCCNVTTILKIRPFCNFHTRVEETVEIKGYPYACQVYSKKPNSAIQGIFLNSSSPQ